MNCKKILSWIMVLSMLISLGVGTQLVFASSPESDFTFFSAWGTITKYVGNGGAVDIPTTIGGVSVTAIEGIAFQNCTNITSIIIPASVKTIGFNAFAGCTKLTSVVIPDGVTSIAQSAFDGCTSLTSLTIPGSVTSIEQDAFHSCTSLSSLTILNGFTTIMPYAFDGCSSLSSISLPNSLTKIGIGAFQDCVKITGLTIPSSVTILGLGAFRGCTGLTSITIPGLVTNIDYDAFALCTSLNSVNILNGVPMIDEQAFRGCSNLTNITIPNSVTSIGQNAFEDCSNLASIIIPKNMLTLDSFAFYNCSSLMSVWLYPATPPSAAGSTFLNIPYNAVMHVPAGSLSSYNSSPWRDFTVVAITSTPTPIPTSTPTPTPTAAPTPTATPTPTTAPASTAMPTSTPDPLSTADPSSTATPTPTSAPTPTATPTPAVTPTPASTSTPKPTSTPSVVVAVSYKGVVKPATAFVLTVNEGAIIELANIKDAVVKTLPIGTENTQSGVEAAMLVLANAAVNSNYKVTIAADSTYNSQTKAWAGKFVVTHKDTAEDAITDKVNRKITVVITPEVVAKISKATATNGTIIIVLDKVPTATPVAGDFTATSKIGTATASALTTSNFVWNPSTKTVTYTFTALDVTTSSQSVVVAVTYKGAAKPATAFVIPAVNAGAITELAKVKDTVVKTVINGTDNTQSGVETAMLVFANAAVNSAYTVTIGTGSTYDSQTKKWTGKFVVTHKDTAANTMTDKADRKITVVIAPVTVAKISRVTATNGTIAILLDKLPTVAPVATDFSATSKIDAFTAIDLTISDFAWNPATKTATFSFAAIDGIQPTQSVVVAATYKGVEKAATAFIVPTITAGAAKELAKIKDAVVKTLPIGTGNSQSSVEATMLLLANAAVSSSYTVTLAPDSAYDSQTKKWTGKFVVANKDISANTITDKVDRKITVVITPDVVAKVSKVTAYNGTITIVLDKVPTTAPLETDFTATSKIGTAAASALTISDFAWDSVTKTVTYSFVKI